MSKMIAGLAGMMLGAAAMAGAVAGAAQAQEAEAAESFIRKSAFERDRQAILEMQGDFKVKFDFIETVSLDPDYEPKERDISGGTEMVRVLEDRGDFISLQHTLVMEHGGQTVVVKHWRQDWQYQPESVMAYKGLDLWEAAPVPAEERAGAWSQTVYQVDDSLRYAAAASWEHDGKVSTWEPDVSWRPLPRRDDTTREDYNVIAAVNRHTVTPWAWWHEQDNSKQIFDGEDTRELVREVGVNSYVRSDEFSPAAGEEYWEKTGDFWAEVRAEWTRLEGTGRIAIHDTPEGDLLYIPMLEIAEKVETGELAAEAGAEQARALIAAQVETGEEAVQTAER